MRASLLESARLATLTEYSYVTQLNTGSCVRANLAGSMLPIIISNASTIILLYIWAHISSAIAVLCASGKKVQR